MQSVDKKYFLFNKGINTEAPLVAWPEGFTIDEQNFDLMPDGSRRRRKGLSYEAGTDSGYFTATTSDTVGTAGTKFYRWANVANNDEFAYVVAQVGGSLYFWNDVKSGPLGLHFEEILLEDFRVSYTDELAEFDPLLDNTYTASNNQISQMTCSFSEIDGKLIVCGEHIEPICISVEDGKFVSKIITIEERDLIGVDDGVAVDVTPEELTPSHQYNLYCRGWDNETIDAVYQSEAAVYPAKNMIQFMGLRKQTESGYSDEDGIKVFSPDKLMGEIFQNMSAPVGHITRNAFNRRYGKGSTSQATTFKAIASVDSVNLLTGRIEITAAAAEHGVIVDDELNIEGLILSIEKQRGGGREINCSGIGTVVEIIDTNSFALELPHIIRPTNPDYKGVISLGQYALGGYIEAPFDGFEPSKTRFALTASFAGRVFYGGCPDTRLADRVYFSKVIEDDKDLGKCFQEADPTSEFISDLLPTDGGYISIPNLGVLKAMVPYGDALLLLSSEGVWAVGPGEGGIFSAVGYSVKKVTDVGCIAKQSVIIADNVPLYWANSGIYAVLQDSNSGFLTTQNLTQDSINELFHSIRYTEKTRVKAGYDPIRKRAFFLYNRRLLNPSNGDASIAGTSDEYSTSVTPLGLLDDTETQEITYDAVLLFDVRLGAWTKWVFGHGNIRVRDIYILPSNYDTDSTNSGLRFLSQELGTQKYALGELTSPSFEDWGYEAPCFLLTGPDSLGEPERLRYAPYVHIFMRKDKAPMVVVSQSVPGGTVAPFSRPIDLGAYVRDPSVYMQPRWDWARGSESGKITNYVQVYRETKPNPDSFGMVVTKNKVRGRGRNLFLAFKAGTKAPAWIDGWTVKYDAQTRI